MTGGAVPPVSVSFFLPSEPLRELVTSYYFVEAAVFLRDRLHPEWGNIRLALSGVWTNQMDGRASGAPQRSSLHGPTDRTSRFETTGGLLLGVGLTPKGWVALIGRQASALANQVCELGGTLGVPGDDLAATLAADEDHQARVNRLNRLLSERAAARGPVDPLIDAIQAAIARGVTVRDLTETLNLSERSLHRLCLTTFGFGPKRLLKRQRFLRTLERVRDHLDARLSEVLDEEYYDQSHFIRDFRAFMGMTPSAYFNSPNEVMRRAAAERRRVVGASLQGLHGT